MNPQEVPQPGHVYRNPARYGKLLPMRSPARELYMKRILIIEDDRDIVELVRYNLVNEGFQVAAAFDGNSGLATIKKTPPDLLLLDLMLPKMSGLEICREIRKEESLNRLPVLMLTARGDEADRVVGLEMGADDYVTKPFSPREMTLRVKGILRRIGGKTAPAEVLKFGDLTVDIAKHEVTIKGKVTELTATEFKLLTTLLERRGRVQSRDRLLTDVWGYEGEVDTRTVDTHMRRLRGKLGRGADYIETVRGVGYRFAQAP